MYKIQGYASGFFLRVDSFVTAVRIAQMVVGGAEIKSEGFRMNYTIVRGTSVSSLRNGRDTVRYTIDSVSPLMQAIAKVAVATL